MPPVIASGSEAIPPQQYQSLGMQIWQRAQICLTPPAGLSPAARPAKIWISKSFPNFSKILFGQNLQYQ
jgi:hypothetical protein